MIGFRQDCINCDAGNFTCSSQVKRSLAQFTCVTCSLPVNTGKFTCFEAASTSRRVHAIAVNKARKLQVTSPAWCRLTYLQFAREFTRGVRADCLQLQVILRGIVRVFFPAFAVIFACVWRVFLPAIPVFLPVSCMYFCQQKQANLHATRGQVCMSSACKLPVKYLWYSGKFTCARKQCAGVLREVLAASKQVILPVITGKLHVTQVNCARDLFTCELHEKSPAFAGNFARASFTVYEVIIVKWTSFIHLLIRQTREMSVETVQHIFPENESWGKIRSYVEVMNHLLKHFLQRKVLGIINIIRSHQTRWSLGKQWKVWCIYHNWLIDKLGENFYLSHIPCFYWLFQSVKHT